MCGIAGILGMEAGTRVTEMIEALRHRGPDCQATLALPNAYVGAARLRIVDLTAGDQPLVSSRTGAVLVFNGEIYNYPELRARLEARSHRFETNTDSEVVLRAYEEYGWHCVDHLRGMYAFAIIDRDRAFLARDPFGIKPLHYCWLDQGRTLVFASEIKALLRHPGVPARINDAALGDLHLFQYIADQRATLFQDIYNLEPGRCLEISLSANRLEHQTHIFVRPPETRESGITLETAERELDELLDTALRSHQLADVPICITLSGGLDSTLLALLLKQQRQDRIVSYVTGDDESHPDVRQAAHVAQMLGFEHRLITFSFNQYLEAIVPAVLASESFVDGVPQYLMFQQLGREFRVALNGEGADELQAGYPEHWRAAEYVARFRAAPASLRLTDEGERERERLLSTASIDCDQWMYRHLLGAQLVDRHLHPLDKLSMAASVEVRVPFLDGRVAAHLMGLPPSFRLNRELGSSKYLLRRVYLQRWRATQQSSGLVDAVLREKRGLPDARRASDGRFHHLCNRVLTESYFAAHPRADLLFHKTQALWFDLFERLFCEGRGQLPEGWDMLEFLSEKAARPRSEVVALAAAPHR